MSDAKQQLRVLRLKQRRVDNLIGQVELLTEQYEGLDRHITVALEELEDVAVDLLMELDEKIDEAKEEANGES